jgi:hypothetical protein
LVKLSYVEFDLDRIFSEELFADFAVLYRLLHVSRLPKSPEHAAESLLERYHQDALESGARIRDGLRVAVEQAIRELGTGFLARTPALQAAVAAGTLAPRDFYHGLLRLIYRLLFLMTAEERGLLFPRDADPRKRRIYETHYSLARLRRLAERRHMVEPGKGDLWLGLCSTFRLFVEESAGAPLGLTALCGHLFSSDSLGPLRDAALDNATLLSALAPLSVFRDHETGQRVRVNYGALATEEFGSVYESLLELHPVLLDGTPPRFTFKQAAGNERKTTGSYYTPSSLVECLLDSALDPVVEQRLAGKKGADAEQAILSLNVCDPAVGSGHFLIAAGHRLARRLASIRAGDDEPSPDQLRHSLREVIGHCLYGVDVNPMSVELCKVTLWLEATEPGKPLSFLDHHIQCGNSLLGATPRVIADGLPDDAFKPLTGDEKAVCAEAKKRNKSERQQLALFHGTETKPWEHLGNLPAAMIEVETMSDDTAAGLHRKEHRYAELVRSASYENARFLADAWCAAFVWKKTSDLPYPITNDVLRKIERNPHDCAPWMREEIERLREQYQFFHWHLAFSEVFPLPGKGEPPENQHAGWKGGFDVMLGNPPWDRVALQEKEWFAERRPDIAASLNASSRKKAIDKLKDESTHLWNEWQDALRQADGEVALLRQTDRFPLCGCGDVNTYSVFTELNRSLAGRNGRAACIVPTGIATDATTQLFFRDLIETRSLACLLGFENEGKLFAGVDHRVNFCLLVMQTTPSGSPATFAAFLRHPDVLQEADRLYQLDANDIALLNPNTRTCPVFRTQRDAELTKSIYRRVPVLWKDDDPNGNPWDAAFRSMFHMSGDSGLFRTNADLTADGWTAHGNHYVRDDRRMLPLYEAKMVYHFNHRFGDFALVPPGERAHILPTPGHDLLTRPDYVPMPRYWVAQEEVERRTDEWWSSEWFLGWRDVTDPRSSVRTVVTCVTPRTAVSGKFPILLTRKQPTWCVYAMLSSFVLDYITRQKLGGVSLSMFIMRQLPVLPPATYAEPCAWAGQPAIPLRDWLLPRVLELTYTAWDLEPFARDCGWFGPPFVWDEARRFQLRCELDAAFFHLYGLSREDAAYILDTFPIVRRKDEAAYGTYRTRDTILEHFDELRRCAAEGRAFTNAALALPAADPCAAHEPRLPATPRVTYAGKNYFETVLPLLLRIAPDGLETAQLFHAMTLLTDGKLRATEAARHLGESGGAWAAAFREAYRWEDAAGALVGEIAKHRIRGVARLRLAPDAAVVEGDPWLGVDAFMALRLALSAETAMAAHSEAAHAETKAQIITLLKAA